MANYIFETMSASDAASFTADDYLLFISSGANAQDVTVTPHAASGLTTDSVDLTYNGTTLTFPADTLSAASQMASDHIVFNDGSQLVIGGTAADALTSTSSATASSAGGTSSVLYGLAGSDTIHGSATGNDYLYGGTDDTTPTQLATTYTGAGAGGDTITAGDGNNHIYGNSLTTQQGATDGNDSITAGAGSNYINGNAGNDFITVGTNAGAGGVTASTGADRVLGGAGNDHIVIQGSGYDQVNGNTGNDYIDASSSHVYVSGGPNAAEVLRGGMGNDTILASQGQDQIMGDVGNDSLVAGTGAHHITVMTGGAGVDTFDFSATGSASAGTAFGGVAVYGSTATGYQEITDFTQGTDHIHLGFTVATDTPTQAGIITDTTGATFTTVQAAETYAQSLLNSSASADHAVAIEVGGNAYVFYAASGVAGANIDSVIQLDHIDAHTLSQTTAGVTAGTSTFA